MLPAVPVSQGPVAPWIDRLIAAVLLLGAATAVWLLVQATPDPRGYNTHVQLGYQPCSWPGTYGIPCPTCGVTTAACHLLHGHPIAAFTAQPFGALLALSGLAAAGVASWCLFRGRSLMDLVARLPYHRILPGGLLLLLGSWFYKYLTLTPP